LLRGAPDTHLGLSEVVRMAVDIGIAETPVMLAHHLDILVDVGLLGRLPSTAAEPVFDTNPEPHAHLIYEDTGQIVDLHVSVETLLAIVRQTLTNQPGGVEILIRLRHGTALGS
jgi:Fe2+ or Zn2+ uptake regulation protein